MCNGFLQFCFGTVLCHTIPYRTIPDGAIPHHITTHTTTPNSQNLLKLSIGTLLACFYWGYTATQIPAGLLAIKYGGVTLFGLAIFCSSVLTLMTPLIVRQDVYVFIVLRVIEGLFLVSLAGVIYNWIGNFLTSFSPPIHMKISQAATGCLFNKLVASKL